MSTDQTRASAPGRRIGTLGLVAAAAVFAGLAFLLPRVAPNAYFLHIVCIGLIFAVLAASWDFLYGYTGQISFGHAGFFGLGAYASALLSAHAGIDPWLTVPMAVVIAAVFGAIVALPSLRLSGVYLALTTLAFAEVLRVVATNWQELTRGTLGFSQHPMLPGIGRDPATFYYLMLVVAVGAVGLLHWIGNRSSFGLVLRAVRDDETRAKALGVDVVRAKVLAFVISAALAGLVGALYAHYVNVITPSDLAADRTMITIAMTTIGGIGSIVGPAIAAVVLHVLMEELHLFGAVYRLVAVGIMLILFVIFLPTGLAGLWRRLTARGRA